MPRARARASMTSPSSRERIPPLRIAWAAFLGLSLLAMTYVLFDPDLGTDAPLFGEFTCRGAIEVELAHSFGGDHLTMPDSGLVFNATEDGAPVHVVAVLFVQQPGEEFEATQSLNAPSGSDFFYLAKVTPGMAVFVRATDVEGKVCRGDSRTLTTLAGETA